MQYDIALTYLQYTAEFWKLFNSSKPGRPGPQNAREFLTLLKNPPEDEAQHGEKFEYKTANTDLLAWIVDTILRNNSEIGATTTEEYIGNTTWSKLGMGSDALVVLDPALNAYFGSGMLTTLRDLARFGAMLLNGGSDMRGKEVIPKAIVDELHHPPEYVFKKAQRNLTGEVYRGYHDQFWVMKTNPEGWYPNKTFFYSEGYNGQYLVMFPFLNCVVAKNSRDKDFKSHAIWFLWAMERLCASVNHWNPPSRQCEKCKKYGQCAQKSNCKDCDACNKCAPSCSAEMDNFDGPIKKFCKSKKGRNCLGCEACKRRTSVVAYSNALQPQVYDEDEIEIDDEDAEM